MTYQTYKRYTDAAHEVREDLRINNEPVECLPSLPQRASRSRNQNCFVTGSGRAVQPELRADPQRPGVLRRVWRPRRWILRDHITGILGLDSPHRVGIIGAGRLGTALANYNGFGRSNFTVVALFDNDREKIGHRIGDGNILVHDVDEVAKLIREEAIDVMVIAVPAKAAQRVLNQVMSAGIKAVLNFAPVSLTPRRGVKVKTVDLTTSLESLSYFLSQPSNSTVTQPRRKTSQKEAWMNKQQDEI
jgi:hypothetical protein